MKEYSRGSLFGGHLGDLVLGYNLGGESECECSCLGESQGTLEAP